MRQILLIGKSAGGLFVGGTQGGRRLVLQLHHPSRRTGLPEDLFQEQGHRALRLSEAAHQESHQSDQPRPGLTGRNARRQFGTRRDPACGAQQAMKLIFRHERSDLRHFPDLMPQRLGVISRQPVPTAATRRRLERHTSLHCSVGIKVRSCLGCPGCPPRFLPEGCRGGAGLACGCCDAGRQRGILRSLVRAAIPVL